MHMSGSLSSLARPSIPESLLTLTESSAPLVCGSEVVLRRRTRRAVDFVEARWILLMAERSTFCWNVEVRDEEVVASLSNGDLKVKDRLSNGRQAGRLPWVGMCLVFLMSVECLQCVLHRAG